MSTTELSVEAEAPQAEAMPAAGIDWLPLLLLPAMAIFVRPLLADWGTWLTLTVHGLAMGMIIFVVASGLTLIFGLLRVLNFGHGFFIALGAYIAASVLDALYEWVRADDLLLNLAASCAAILSGAVVCGIIGIAFERILVRPVYGRPLSQILITTGGMAVGGELIKLIWGGQSRGFQMPFALRGSIEVASGTFEKFRLFAGIVGVLVFIAMVLVLNRTKIGLLIRAGVQNAELVECMGYRIKLLFVGVFAIGCALAGLGGATWGMYQQLLFPELGASLFILIFIVLNIGGMGSVGGALLGSLLIGVLTNYANFLAPKLALVSSLLLLAAILAWRPNGLYKMSEE